MNKIKAHKDTAAANLLLTMGERLAALDRKASANEVDIFFLAGFSVRVEGRYSLTKKVPQRAMKSAEQLAAWIDRQIDTAWPE